MTTEIGVHPDVYRADDWPLYPAGGGHASCVTVSVSGFADERDRQERTIADALRDVRDGLGWAACLLTFRHPGSRSHEHRMRKRVFFSLLTPAADGSTLVAEATAVDGMSMGEAVHLARTDRGAAILLGAAQFEHADTQLEELAAAGARKTEAGMIAWPTLVSRAVARDIATVRVVGAFDDPSVEAQIFCAMTVAGKVQGLVSRRVKGPS